MRRHATISSAVPVPGAQPALARSGASSADYGSDAGYFPSLGSQTSQPAGPLSRGRSAGPGNVLTVSEARPYSCLGCGFVFPAAFVALAAAGPACPCCGGRVEVL